MSHSAIPAVHHASTPRVSTLELFFDLVFVFTITQLAHLAEAAHGPADFGRAFLILSIAWWMYDGYVFLTNNVGTNGLVIRLLMLCGMAAYFVMALSIPHANSSDGVVFGVCFLIVTLVHLGLFRRAPSASAAGIMMIAPYNITAALFVVAAGFLTPEWRWLGWLSATMLFLMVSFRRRERGVQTSAGHFAERHGLVIIIAIGESVVSLGAAPSGLPIGFRLISIVALGFALCAALWWSYFDGDDALAEHALTSLPEKDRTRIAVLAYSYPHMAMIAGIVCLSAGLHAAIAALGGPIPAHDAWLISIGIGIYLLGSSKFRGYLHFARARSRSVTALIAAATAPIGWAVGSSALLFTLTLVFISMLMIEQQHR